MAIKIDDKVFLNMPEQVAKNQSDIEKLAEQYDMLTHPISDISLSNDGDLIFTLSNGETVDAGLVKSVSSFSIDASQHLIVTYVDGSTEDLGAIFSGNISISGNLTVSGGIAGNAITGDSIIENMSGYSFIASTEADVTFNYIYVGAVKNGNKLTTVIYAQINLSTTSNNFALLGRIKVPSSIYNVLYPTNIGGNQVLDHKKLTVITSTSLINSIDINAYIAKYSDNLNLFVERKGLSANVDYLVRYETTFLLSDNLAA